MPKEWANHRHIAWQWDVESFTTWSCTSSYHEVATEMRSPIRRYSSLIRLWWGDRLTSGISWWCTWWYAARASPAFSPMTAFLLEYSRMRGLIWAGSRTSRPRVVMIHMLSSHWGGWSLRRPSMDHGLGERSDQYHSLGDRDRCIMQ